MRRSIQAVLLAVTTGALGLVGGCDEEKTEPVKVAVEEAAAAAGEAAEKVGVAAKEAAKLAASEAQEAGSKAVETAKAVAGEAREVAGEAAEKVGEAVAGEAAPAAAPAKAPAAAAPVKAEVGKPAPGFTLTDTEGKTVSLSSFAGKRVVLEWFNPDCPFVVYAHNDGPLSDLAKRHASDGVVWLAINSGAPGKQGHGLERNAKARVEYKLEHPVLLDEDGKVGQAYGATNTPGMAVVDEAGVVRYLGALDNAPFGRTDGERVEYVSKALADLAAGREVEVKQTKAYGCSVKYAN